MQKLIPKFFLTNHAGNPPSELQSYETVSDTVKVESGTNDVRNGDTGAENAAVSNQESVVLHQMGHQGKRKSEQPALDIYLPIQDFHLYL
mgnify:CR=1 FL=1